MLSTGLRAYVQQQSSMLKQVCNEQSRGAAAGACCSAETLRETLVFMCVRMFAQKYLWRLCIFMCMIFRACVYFFTYSIDQPQH